MNLELSKTFYGHFNGREVDTFANIVHLAAKQLAQSPETQMKGTPLKSQAGIKGADLINTKAMIASLADELGLDQLDTDAPATGSLTFLIGVLQSN